MIFKSILGPNKPLQDNASKFLHKKVLLKKTELMGDGLLSPILQWATTCDHVRVAQDWCAQNDQAI